MKTSIKPNDVKELTEWVTSIGKQIIDGTIYVEPNGKHLIETYQRMLNLLYKDVK